MRDGTIKDSTYLGFIPGNFARNITSAMMFDSSFASGATSYGTSGGNAIEICNIRAILLLQNTLHLSILRLKRSQTITETWKVAVSPKRPCDANLNEFWIPRYCIISQKQFDIFVAYFLCDKCLTYTQIVTNCFVITNWKLAVRKWTFKVFKKVLLRCSVVRAFNMPRLDANVPGSRRSFYSIQRKECPRDSARDELLSHRNI